MARQPPIDDPIGDATELAREIAGSHGLDEARVLALLDGARRECEELDTSVGLVLKQANGGRHLRADLRVGAKA